MGGEASRSSLSKGRILGSWHAQTRARWGHAALGLFVTILPPCPGSALSCEPAWRGGGCAELCLHPFDLPPAPDLPMPFRRQPARPSPPRPHGMLSTARLHPTSLPVWESPPGEAAGPNLAAPHPGSLPLGKGAARPGGGISLSRFPCIVRAWVIEEILQVLLLPSGHGGSPAPFPPLSAAGPYPRSKPRPLKIALCQAIVPTPSRRH